jgi:hypothetical protein
MMMVPPSGGATEPRSAAAPVTGRPSRGRLYAGTARRVGAALSPALAEVFEPLLRGELLPALLRGELLPPLLPPSPRDTACPLLLLPPRERDPCWSAREGASNDDHADGVGDDPITLLPLGAPPPPPLFELLELPPLDPLDPLSPPRETALPPESPPRGAALPVVLPLDVREPSWPAQAVSPVKLITPNAMAKVLTNR